MCAESVERSIRAAGVVFSRTASCTNNNAGGGAVKMVCLVSVVAERGNSRGTEVDSIGTEMLEQLAFSHLGGKYQLHFQTHQHL